jgi:hypothetical protein
MTMTTEHVETLQQILSASQEDGDPWVTLERIENLAAGALTPTQADQANRAMNNAAVLDAVYGELLDALNDIIIHATEAKKTTSAATIIECDKIIARARDVLDAMTETPEEADAPPVARGPAPNHMTDAARDAEVQRRLDSGDKEFAAALDQAMRSAHQAGLHELPTRFCPICDDAARRLNDIAGSMLDEALRVQPRFHVVLLARDEQGRCVGATKLDPPDALRMVSEYAVQMSAAMRGT